MALQVNKNKSKFYKTFKDKYKIKTLGYKFKFRNLVFYVVNETIFEEQTGKQLPLRFSELTENYLENNYLKLLNSINNSVKVEDCIEVSENEYYTKYKFEELSN